jgi:ribosome-associated protein
VPPRVKTGPKSTALPKSLERARAAARVAIENNAQDVLLLDVRQQSPLFDYFLIATGRSGRQLRAISDEIDDLLQKELGDERMGTEGYRDSRWIVLDYGDVIIQLFDGTSRNFYRLDELWADAVRVDISDLIAAESK